MKIAVVIPAYNESKVIAPVISDVRHHADAVVVVDDGSGDETARTATIAGAIVVSHEVNRGQGAALQTGITYATEQGYDVIVTFDADGQHRASEIPDMIAPIINDGMDVALGSRFLNKKTNLPFSRKIVLKIAAFLTRLYTGLAVTDAHNGFRAFSRQAASLISLRHEGMAHASEILEQIRQHNLRYREVPVTIVYTDYSLAKGQRLSNAFSIVWELFIGKLTK